jgi:putative resolvase
VLKLLTDPTLTLIAACAPRSGVVEHQDRLSRFGFNYIEQLLKLQGRRIEVVNLVENGKEDLIQDFVSIVPSFCARLYGRRRSKPKMERLIAELQAEEPHDKEGYHPSETRPSQPKQTRKTG